MIIHYYDYVFKYTSNVTRVGTVTTGPTNHHLYYLLQTIGNNCWHNGIFMYVV